MALISEHSWSFSSLCVLSHFNKAVIKCTYCTSLFLHLCMSSLEFKSESVFDFILHGKFEIGGVIPLVLFFARLLGQLMLLYSICRLSLSLETAGFLFGSC